jgi:RNA polymerase sigma-70 factor (ECF subfamily)
MELLRPVHGKLEAFALAMTRNRDEARDLVSETLLRSYEHFNEIRTPAAFAAYLLTTASRACKRQRWRRRIFGAYDQDYAESIGDGRSAPDERADVDALYRALSQLPDAQREAIVLFEISGLTLEEIQRVQGGSLSGVKSRIVRGRQRLVRMLDGGRPGHLQDSLPVRNDEQTPDGHRTLYFGVTTNE